MGNERALLVVRNVTLDQELKATASFTEQHTAPSGKQPGSNMRQQDYAGPLDRDNLNRVK